MPGGHIPPVHVGSAVLHDGIKKKIEKEISTPSRRIFFAKSYSEPREPCPLYIFLLFMSEVQSFMTVQK
jgi:hypothetical protein